ncbi:MAG: metallophosphoesterase [Anaerolineae bacterium]|nr:metallophosphoesterase [Thermoflexales bacterium]MDW8407487.1 metallophosphoesterase [Anaerolineae bacterium]
MDRIKIIVLFSLAALLGQPSRLLTAQRAQPYAPTQGYRAFLPIALNQPTRIAVIGDFGLAGAPAAAVANLVISWQPQYIVTTGDNNYYTGLASTIDQNIGQYYADFIHPYFGSYPAPHNPGFNRFFPAIGNHDWNSADGYAAHLNYFTLPGHERYYDVLLGPVHWFILNSDSHEPDGITPTSAQAQWLQNKLAASTACWQIVVLHHAPYSSSAVHGSTPATQWPYATWGVDVVIAGHDHTYERLSRDGIVYLVNGIGGAPLYAFGLPIAGSVVRYNADYGALRIDATASCLRFDLLNTASVAVDSFELTGGCAW